MSSKASATSITSGGQRKQQHQQLDHSDNEDMDDDDANSDLDSDDESFYGDYTNNDLIGASISDNAECKWTLNMGRTRRNGQKRFFWQYNVQSKGPKGVRMCNLSAQIEANNPASNNGAQIGSGQRNEDNLFVLPEASDPVFSQECQIEGVKHSGKARRGDGNDLTPNPRKLLMIGLELKKLSKIINELAPVTDLPLNARNKTRKEKNKLASRACRLKKKAQHEANKIKLFGLQREHQQVVAAIYNVRKVLNKSLKSLELGQTEFQLDLSSTNQQIASTAAGRTTAAPTSYLQNQKLVHLIKIGQNLETKVQEFIGGCSMQVAGRSSDYVNSVLEKVVSGCIDGGLQT